MKCSGKKTLFTCLAWIVVLVGLGANETTASPVRQDLAKDLFCVIDLSGGADAECWPVFYLPAVPEGGWTDEYKTKKLVLRRVEAGRVSGLKTKDDDEFTSIVIDRPYYIGVFEVTDAQYKLMRTRRLLFDLGFEDHPSDTRPRTGTSYDLLRGESKGSLYPASADVDAESIVGVLREKTGIPSLDLPTERQWEYACRAGTTSDYNNGGSAEADLKMLGRYRGNLQDGHGQYNGDTTAVGSYAPNRWGLYDMHGNASEWCLDWYAQNGLRVVRGGNSESCKMDCRSGARHASRSSDFFDKKGFRLCCFAER